MKKQLEKAYRKGLSKLVGKYDHDGSRLEALNSAVVKLIEKSEHEDIENIEHLLFKQFKDCRLDMLKKGKRTNPVTNDAETVVDFDTDWANTLLADEIDPDNPERAWLNAHIESNLDDDREKRLYRQYFVGGWTQAEIAESEGVSRPMIVKILDRIQRKIGAMELADMYDIRDYWAVPPKHPAGKHISDRQLYNVKPGEGCHVEIDGQTIYETVEKVDGKWVRLRALSRPLFDRSKCKSLLRVAHGSNYSAPMIEAGIDKHIGVAFKSPLPTI